jgi:transcriptional regulator with GAF, ATPase, and Fis domain
MPSDPRIRRAMEHAAQAMNDPQSAAQALHALTVGAVEAIPGADYASITSRHRGGWLETVAASDPLIEALDARQYELQEGPCYAAAMGQETISVSFDMERDGRWPCYGPIAAQAGVHAQMGVLLAEDASTRTGLNVYASEPHDFDDASVEVAELFASHAAVAMGYVQAVRTLGEAVTSRQVIGEAVGIVMERYQIDDERAFQFLVRTSQDSNVKLREVAAQIVAGHNSRHQRAER